MNLIKKYHRSKWTSIEKLHGWRHYEVKNIFIQNKELEMFSICNKENSLRVKVTDINDNTKWVRGWKKIV
tara:strand:- start:438 stop:647 length:210 start_codon:yes stop_codon:yes gene_type:complete